MKLFLIEAGTSPTPPFLPPTGGTWFLSPGDTQYLVPQGVTNLRLLIWGAAGGGTETYNQFGTFSWAGGEGGFVDAQIPVTPGQTLIVRIGQGGARNVTATSATGGGGCGNGSGIRSSGGGLSGLFLGSASLANALVIAGGGGGAGGNRRTDHSRCDGGGADSLVTAERYARDGGHGKIALGGEGGAWPDGTHAAETGAALAGGRGYDSSAYAGGGGGGGYRGGGGGSDATGATGSGFGGGGASYIFGPGITVTNRQGATNSHPWKPAGVGVDNGYGTAGGPGAIYLVAV